MSLSGPIDRDRLQEYSGGDVVFEQELLTLFVEDAQQHLASIEAVIDAAKDNNGDGLTSTGLPEGLSATDLEIIYQKAHHLKGSSGSIGAERFEAIATQLEQAARQSQPCSSSLSDLKIAFAELTIQIRQWPD
jgi:histidine phosphotransfer protein HptB